jgi:NADPH-dependent F420 reductase
VAIRLASGGYTVVIGGRDGARAAEVASTIAPHGSGAVTGADNATAAQQDIVIVATPWDSAVATVKENKASLEGKVVISMVNALTKEGREMLPLYPPRGSMAAQLAAAVPGAFIAGAFHHLPAAQMEDLDSGLDADVIIFGDHAQARDVTAELVAAMPGLHPIVAGSLSLAAPVEAFTAVCISINIRHKAHSYVRLDGLTR